MSHSVLLDRKSFISGALAVPFFGGCCSFGCRNKPVRRPGPNDLVNVGVIGCGLIAKGTNVPGFLNDPRCRVTIACDMVREAPEYFYGARRSNFGAEGLVAQDGSARRDVCGSRIVKALIDKRYGNTDCREVFDWREVIADPSIDAVCICTPDHWHAIIAIAAMRAGKHVFCQKPMSLGIEEGKAMVRVAKETGVTFQVGNQGRSNPSFRLSEELVLNGYAGAIKGATICIPGNDHWEGHGHSPARAPLPKYFTKEGWDLWQGPARHWEGNAYIPCIHDPTCWRFNERYGGGMITDFGAHEFDQLQRGLGTDLSGPIAMENMKTDLRKDNDVFSWAGKFSFDFVYANGVRVHVRTIDKEAGYPRQTVFHCEKGDVGSRSGKGVLPPELAKFKESDFTDKDKRLYAPKNGHDGSKFHESDFLDGILERRQCCSPCEVGHRTISLAHIANICEQLRTDRLDWDPVREVFTGKLAAEANALTKTEYHNGWSLDA